MSARVSTRDRRAMKLGLIAAGLFAAVNFGVKPGWRALGELSEAVEEERALLTREIELLESAPGYADGVEAGGTRLLELAPRLFGGETEGLASAYLAEYVQEAARSSRALVTRLDPGSVEPAGPGMESLSALVHGESDLEGLLTLLYLLEGGEKLVQVSDLRIRGTRATTAALPAMEVVSFEMQVTGFQLLPFERGSGPPETPAAEVGS